jgi:hypothetical protein
MRAPRTGPPRRKELQAIAHRGRAQSNEQPGEAHSSPTPPEVRSFLTPYPARHRAAESRQCAQAAPRGLGSPTTSFGDSRGKARSNATPVAIGGGAPGNTGRLRSGLRRWSHVSPRRIDSHVDPGWRRWRCVRPFAGSDRGLVTARGWTPVDRSRARHRPNSAEPYPDNAEHPSLA